MCAERRWAMAKKTPSVELSPDEEALLQRLKRIEGQMRGLQRMVIERRNCYDIITQLMAARSALDQVGLTLLNDHLDRCLPVTEETSGSVDLAQLRRTLKLWARFGS